MPAEQQRENGSKLVYSAICSLDGFVADRDGNFDWAAPDAEVHAFVNDLERPVGTYLYGRRIYEIMKFWQTALESVDDDPVVYDFARVWMAAEKIVYSATLDGVSTPRTRLERRFDPAEVRRLKQQSSTDLSIGGATLAASALAAGLVDEVRMFVNPVIVGGGLSALPPDLRLDLELTAERRFVNGVVFVQYRVR